MTLLACDFSPFDPCNFKSYSNVQKAEHLFKPGFQSSGDKKLKSICQVIEQGKDNFFSQSKCRF